MLLIQNFTPNYITLKFKEFEKLQNMFTNCPMCDVGKVSFKFKQDQTYISTINAFLILYLIAVWHEVCIMGSFMATKLHGAAVGGVLLFLHEKVWSGPFYQSCNEDLLVRALYRI